MLVLEARGQATVGEIREVLGLGWATASVWVDQGEKEGRLERFKDHVDHRRTWVRLTPKGKRERKRARDNKGEQR